MLTLSRCSSPSASPKVSSSNPDRRNRWVSLDKPALGVAQAIGVLTAGQAQAFVVNVGGQDYDVTTFTGSYNANTRKFATAANGGVMSWWGDEALVNEFAIKVRFMGYPTGEPFNGDRSAGPLFAFFREGLGILWLLLESRSIFTSTFLHLTYVSRTYAHLRAGSPRNLACCSRHRPSPCPWRRRCLRLQPSAEKSHQT